MTGILGTVLEEAWSSRGLTRGAVQRHPRRWTSWTGG